KANKPFNFSANIWFIIRTYFNLKTWKKKSPPKLGKNHWTALSPSSCKVNIKKILPFLWMSFLWSASLVNTCVTLSHGTYCASLRPTRLWCKNVQKPC
ncbi:MAG: hypothetical protein L3J61_06050, partial [Ghiorsea sp.]|nr:hypothetical protein [Ghiorsea sp.]